MTFLQKSRSLKRVVQKVFKGRKKTKTLSTQDSIQRRYHCKIKARIGV
jgi:hypothetical protein